MRKEMKFLKPMVAALLFGIVVLSAVAAESVTKASDGSIKTVPNEPLGTRLKREVGGGGPVAILAGTSGLFAVSSDGKRKQLLWPQPTAWVLVDARGRQIWFGAADKGSTNVLSLDLDAVAPQPVVVATGVPNDLRIAIVYRQGKTEESLHFSSGILHGQLRLIVGGKAPLIDYDKGMYDMIFEEEGATAQRAAKKARLTVEGKAVLAALPERATGRHVAAKIPPPSRKRVKNVDASRCEEASICGSAEAFGASPYLRVTVGHICGDACQIDYQLYDPRTTEFFDYSQTGRRSPSPLGQSPDLEDVWIAPDGSAFVMKGALYGFDGMKVVGGDNTGGGWLDTPAHLD